MPKYKYKPLKDPASQIRLLHLWPGDPDDPVCLKGTLSQHNLADRPAYVALTYEWGDLDPVVDFRLDGALIQIRYNLWTLLDTILLKVAGRKIPDDTCFWIDALCIDQASLAEKNAQVALMGTIYSSASLVFAWLGRPSSENPDQVFEYLLSESRALKSRSYDAEYQYKVQRSSDFAKVLALRQCRYWTRRWILQELVLPKKVIVFWGGAELDLTDLLNLVTTLQAYQSPYAEQFMSSPTAYCVRLRNFPMMKGTRGYRYCLSWTPSWIWIATQCSTVYMLYEVLPKMARA